MSEKLSVLKNGLRVVTKEMPHVETISVGLWIEAGARYESAAQQGVSHFLEHMAFKGTEKRTAKQIAEAIENVGGYLNAYTSKETTAYYARVLKENLTLALDVISDIMLRPTFCLEEMNKERNVILQEIGQNIDAPDEFVFDLFQDLAFPEQPLGRNILGTPEIINSMTPDVLRSYMNEHYAANTMVLAASGNLKHDEFIKQAEDFFLEFKPAIENKREFIKAAYCGGEKSEKRDLEQVHVVLGTEGVPLKDKDYYASGIFTSILGGGMSSRLFQEVREKRGLVYSIYSSISSYKDSGLFGVYAGTSQHQVKELIEIIKNEIEKMSQGITEIEFQRARAQFKSGLFMLAESTISTTEQLANQTIIFGKPLSMEELTNKITAVSKQQIAEFANRLLNKKTTIATVGPID